MTAPTILDPTVTDSGLLVMMPSGDACFYVGEEATSETMRHSYWRANWKRKLKRDPEAWHRGTRLTGVSTATKVLDVDPKHLLKWAARQNGIGIAQFAWPVISELIDNPGADPALAGELNWLCNHETIWETLERNALTYDDVKEAKGTIGTNVHELAFQAMAMGRAVPHLDRLTTEEQGHAQAIMAFWLDHDPDPQQVEQIVVDAERGIAGRMDFRGTLRAECDDDRCPCRRYLYEGPGVIDAKTGNYLGPSAHAQVAGYRSTAEAAGFGPSLWGALLKTRDDGTYTLIDGEATPEEFAAAVTTYRIAGRIDREAGKTMKARKNG